eukprot:m.306183 g.306183  ORF g.306183 m.306183 type:complete len:638 (+) comp41027_c0_seq1:230-2143(+)
MMSTEIEIVTTEPLTSLDDSPESPESMKARDATKQLALLYHERQVQLTSAEEKIKRLETALEAAEDRLQQQSSHHSSSTGGGKSGPKTTNSRKVVEELAKENTRLKATIRSNQSNTGNEEWVLVTAELRKENSHLRSQLKTTKTALDSLNPSVSGGEAQSAEEILRLSEKLVEVEEQLKVRNALIDGLSTQLSCAQKEFERMTSELHEARVSLSQRPPDGEETTQMKAEIETLNIKLRKEEANATELRKALQEVEAEKSQAIQVTHNWDSYCKGQQKIIDNLQEQCARLNGQTEQLKEGQESRKRDVERVLLSAKQLVDKERKDRVKAEGSVKHFQNRFEMLEGKYQLLDHQHKTEMERRLAVERELKGTGGRRKEDADHIAILEQQLAVYKEDFETERRDCERLRSEKDTLEQKLKESKSKERQLNDRNQLLEEDCQKFRRRVTPPPAAELRPNAGSGGVANFPLSSYEQRMVVQHQRRIEDQIKRQQRPSPTAPNVESDLVPRSMNQHLSADSGDIQADGAEGNQRLFTSLTTHAQPITQPTADSDDEMEMSMFGSSRSMVIPSGRDSSDSLVPPSVARMGSLSSGPPAQSLKNSQPPQRKGRGSELVCPRCSAAFPARLGAEYIQHVDKCCSLT